MALCKVDDSEVFGRSPLFTIRSRSDERVPWCSGWGCLLGKLAIAGSNPTLAFKFQRNNMFLPCSLQKIQYCGEPQWQWASVLGLRPPGLEFRILCLEGSVILFISPSSGGSPALVWPIGAQRSQQFFDFQFTQWCDYFSADFADDGPRLNRHWVNVVWLLRAIASAHQMNNRGG